MPADEQSEVTALKRRLEELEKKLQEANRRFSLLVSAPEGQESGGGLAALMPKIMESLHETVAVIFDRDGNYLAAWADPELERRYGVSGAQLRGRNLREFFPPAEAASHLAKLRRIFDEGVSLRAENPVYMPNGVFWQDSVGSPLYDDQGRVAAALLMAQDITRSKHAEQSQAESEQRYRTLVEHSQDFIMLHKDGRILFANPALARALGLESAGELVGREVFAYIHPDSRQQIARRLERLWATGEPLEVEEFKFVGTSGEVFIGESTGQLVTLGGEQVVLSIVRDVTERRRLEREQAGLQQRANRAQKHQSLALMAMGVAHDFNNLLMGILGNASVLAHDLAQNSPQHELARRIERSAVLAGEITRQLLDFAGQARDPGQQTDITATVAELRDTIESRLPDNLELHWQLRQGLPPVNMNPAAIKQLLLNLVDNAADAIGNLAGRITIKTRLCNVTAEQLRAIFHDHELEPGPAVCLEVGDSGCGMSAETVQRIFDPFFSTKEGNRGLGLAGVLGIVMRCRGAIQVHSRPGHGSRFEIWLPPAEPAGDWSCSDPDRGRNETTASGGLILVAEDEQIVAEVVTETLLQAGFQPRLARDGRQACEQFAAAPGSFAAAVLDMNMPGRNGAETLAELRRLRRELPVVLTSGQAEQPSLPDIAGPPPAFLAKPYRPQRLVELLQKLLAG